MDVTILYFHTLRSAVGSASEALEAPDGSTISDAVALAQARHPVIADFRASLLVARNKAYAEPGDPLEDGDEIALMPPVSGG